ncbi:hypothetical protein PLCT2_03020 [Planctomycetaceae bacterium]|nr:hypothetical protein PLCT2_03020 [Planctomycetaceae bacterium]
MSRTNPLNESDRAFVRAEITSTARALSSHGVPFLEGVRKLAALRFEVSQDHHDADFMLFVAIASQADHIPNTEARTLCAESWLAQCDKDTRELEGFYGEEVALACKQLIERFSREA